MNKFCKSILLISLGMGLFSSCVIKQPSDQVQMPRTITVSGRGSVSVKPDLVHLKFLVKTVEWNVARAVERNATNTNNVLTALKEAGVADSDISTFDYSISQDNSNNYPGQYTVRNTIAVVVRNIDTAGAVIDAAVKQNTGANGITEFRYAVSDDASYLRQARTLAIQDAQDAASLIAGASGCKLSSVQSISEFTPDSYSFRAANNFDSTMIQEGSISINSEVTITYNLEN